MTNGYTSQASLKNYLRIYSTGTTPTQLNQLLADDTLLDSLVEDASRVIDRVTNRQFYVTTGTLYLDQTNYREILFDRDILTVTTVTNGDGLVIPSTEYNLFPLNSTPKYSIKLKLGSNTNWQTDSSGNAEGVISIVGTWGFAATVPADIELACWIIASAEYKKRTGEVEQGNGFVTPDGFRVLPSGIPKSAWDILRPYARTVIA